MRPLGHIRVPEVSWVAAAPGGICWGGPSPAQRVLSRFPFTLSTLLGSESGHSQVIVSPLIPNYSIYQFSTHPSTFGFSWFHYCRNMGFSLYFTYLLLPPEAVPPLPSDIQDFFGLFAAVMWKCCFLQPPRNSCDSMRKVWEGFLFSVSILRAAQGGSRGFGQGLWAGSCAQEPSQGNSHPFGVDLTQFFPQERPAALPSWGQLDPPGLSEDLLSDLDVPQL